MKFSNKDLIEKYLRTTWIIKIRLMSARRQLWSDEVSLIHLENGSLQIRKICEAISHLCLIASEIDFEDIPTNIRKKYEVGKVFKHLEKIERLKPICRARLTQKDNQKKNNEWNLDIKEPDSEDLRRVTSIANNCGKILHQQNAFSLHHPSNDDEAIYLLKQDREFIRGEHQWLWNYIWQHAIQISAIPILFFDLRENTEPTRPVVLKCEGFVDDEIEIKYSENYLADFTGSINWGEFGD